MHSQSSRPACIRAKLLSALNLLEKANKNLGVASNDLKVSKDSVKPVVDQCDPLLTALARCNNTVTSHRYARQRSTKVPIRVPAGFPTNCNFSQRLICSFEDVKGEDKEILALEHKLQTRAKVMKCLELLIPDLPSPDSPVLQREDELIHWLLSTSNTQSEGEKNLETMASSGSGSRSIVPSLYNTPSHSQSRESTPYSYLPTPPLASSSIGKSHHSNKTLSLSWSIPRPRRLKEFQETK
ncbi:uncharacterized protein MELLADRAFT_109424 [Melampsora larici-populina 98AG31]|uniref:Uncharacterized protein n=1 Tax=Melampsora larici-populina (strain 98AG31 / pathotype 3-4-7) TaxID=747676 RepID=F4RWF5_MELLP|nr:uncharacterized protein MELLADRAFT_109424 [Melampsora larici-populina 98AG31]EGG03331.1 hypothetical protein MELLADRAFT_109424 [Melampsora larici-populina 98AG31]